MCRKQGILGAGFHLCQFVLGHTSDAACDQTLAADSEWKQHDVLHHTTAVIFTASPPNIRHQRRVFVYVIMRVCKWNLCFFQELHKRTYYHRLVNKVLLIMIGKKSWHQSQDVPASNSPGLRLMRSLGLGDSVIITRTDSGGPPMNSSLWLHFKPANATMRRMMQRWLTTVAIDYIVNWTRKYLRVRQFSPEIPPLSKSLCTSRGND